MGAAPLHQAALRCCCPRCGVGRLYEGLLTIRPACAECGLNLTEMDTGDGAASAVILVLGAVMMGAVFFVEFRFNPPAWIHLLLWPTLTIPLAILLMRPLKAALIMQHYRHRAPEMGP